MITVNGLQIDDNVSYLVEEVTFRSMPQRDLKYQTVSRKSTTKITASDWLPKEIEIKGRVFASSASALRTSLDTLQQNFAVKSVAINIDTDRTYTATLESMDIPTQFYNNTMVQYDVKFLCLDPYSYGSLITVSGTVVSGTQVTYSGTITISGTVFAEPTITINPTGAMAGNSGIKQMAIGYGPTGEQVTWSGTINYFSDVVVNYANLTVTNSGTLSDYSGIHSRWEPGVTGFTVTVSSGTLQGYDWKIAYSPRYYT